VDGQAPVEFAQRLIDDELSHALSMRWPGMPRLAYRTAFLRWASRSLAVWPGDAPGELLGAEVDHPAALHRPVLAGVEREPVHDAVFGIDDQ